MESAVRARGRNNNHEEFVTEIWQSLLIRLHSKLDPGIVPASTRDMNNNHEAFVPDRDLRWGYDCDLYHTNRYIPKII